MFTLDFNERRETSLKFGLNQNYKLEAASFFLKNNIKGISLLFRNDLEDFVSKIYFEPMQGNLTNEEFAKKLTDFNRTITHILLAFYEKRELEGLIKRPFENFDEFSEIIVNLLNKKQGTRVDLFLQYQWSLREDQTVSFLELPNSSKFGAFICQHVEGEFIEERIENPLDTDKQALIYKRKTDGILHPFKRDGWFMKSNYAIKQIKEKPHPWIQELEQEEKSINPPEIPF